VGPGPFVSGSGEAKGPGAQVVQPDGPSEPHRVTVFATDIQPLPLPVVAMESFLTSVSMFSMRWLAVATARGREHRELLRTCRRGFNLFVCMKCLQSVTFRVGVCVTMFTLPVTASPLNAHTTCSG